MNIKNISVLLDDLFIDKQEQLSKHFFNVSNYTILESIPEMLCEWWSGTRKNIREFLDSEGLSSAIDDKTFVDILLNKYYFSNYFLMLIREKLPFNVTLEKLYRDNKKFIKKHKNAELLNIKDALIIQILKDLYNQKKEKREQYICNWHQNNKSKNAEASARYRLNHQEKVKESKKKYRETHKEEIKAYKQSRRKIENEQQRNRYHADIEKNREKRRLYHQNMTEEQKENYAQKKAEYARTHRKEINERARERMKDEAYRQKKREYCKKRYKENSAEIQKRKTERRLQNLEEAKAKERIYGKTYREKNKEEINARNRANYQKNLLENRKKNAEKQKKYRAKKRAAAETTQTVMLQLLDSQKNY